MSISLSSTIVKPRIPYECLAKKRENNQTVADTTSKEFNKSYDEFCKRVNVLKLSIAWQLSSLDMYLQAAYYDSNHTIAKFEIIVNHNYNYTIRVLGWKIKANNYLNIIY